MIKNSFFYKNLNDSGITFFTGVPDSVLKYFCRYIEDTVPKEKHIIAANEGNAVGIAAGYYLATGNPALCYMQNSGLGNAINPLTSLTHSSVYSIPVLLLIGWRGERGVADEPQHIFQGSVTEQLLNLLEIPVSFFDSESDSRKVIKIAADYMKKKKSPYALLVRKNTFEKWDKNNNLLSMTLKREEVISSLLDIMQKKDVVISTTGMASRELFELREKRKESHESDFIMVGSMGHASSIASGIALASKNRTVFCLDGDGAVLMHMGSLPIMGIGGPRNFIHIVLNNGVHESVGGQPTVFQILDLASIVSKCGYKTVSKVFTIPEFVKVLAHIKGKPGPHFIDVHVASKHRDNLGRPSLSFLNLKKQFMDYLNKC